MNYKVSLIVNFSSSQRALTIQKPGKIIIEQSGCLKGQCCEIFDPFKTKLHLCLKEQVL